MKSKPEMSVLMGVHNAGRYLSQAVESVLGQTWGDFELVAVDDGSTDGSGQVLEGYAKTDCRVRVIHQEKKGLAAALNRGLEEVRGRFVVRMDGDDVSLPGRFAMQRQYLLGHESCVAVGSWVREIDPWGMWLAEVRKPTEHEEIDGAFLRGEGGVIAHPAVMMRTQAVKNIGGYRNYPVAQDMDLFLRLGEMGRLANLAEVLLLYRVHFGSASLSRRQEQVRLRFEIVQEARRRRGLLVQTVSEKEIQETVTREVVTKADRCRSWALHAIHQRNRKAAMRYAGQLMMNRPWRLESWKILRWAMAA